MAECRLPGLALRLAQAPILAGATPAMAQPLVSQSVLAREEAVRFALQNNPNIMTVRQQHGYAAAAAWVIAKTYPFNPIYTGYPPRPQQWTDQRGHHQQDLHRGLHLPGAGASPPEHLPPRGCGRGREPDRLGNHAAGDRPVRRGDSHRLQLSPLPPKKAGIPPGRKPQAQRASVRATAAQRRGRQSQAARPGAAACRPGKRIPRLYQLLLKNALGGASARLVCTAPGHARRFVRRVRRSWSSGTMPADPALAHKSWRWRSGPICRLAGPPSAGREQFRKNAVRPIATATRRLGRSIRMTIRVSKRLALSFLPAARCSDPNVARSSIEPT